MHVLVQFTFTDLYVLHKWESLFFQEEKLDIMSSLQNDLFCMQIAFKEAIVSARSVLFNRIFI